MFKLTLVGALATIAVLAASPSFAKKASDCDKVLGGICYDKKGKSGCPEGQDEVTLGTDQYCKVGVAEKGIRDGGKPTALQTETLRGN